MTNTELIYTLFQGSPIVIKKQYNNGIEGEVFNIKKDRETLVVKFLSPSRIKRFPKTIYAEQKLLDYLYKSGMNVPKMYLTNIDYNCICYFHIPGVHFIPNSRHEMTPIIEYLKKLNKCGITEIDYLPYLSKSFIHNELQKVQHLSTTHNIRLQKKLDIVYLNDINYSISHGGFHHGNMIWTKSNCIYLIDWDEAIIAPKEWDIANFFVSQAIYSGFDTAYDFISSCKKEFFLHDDILFFFIQYCAYNILIRFVNWRNNFFSRNNLLTCKQTTILLENILTM